MGVTVEDGGKTLGCGGVVLHDSDTGELWLKLSKKAKPLAVMTGIKASLKILRQSFPGVAFMCRVKEGFEKGERLVKRLGFERDHLEDDYWIYTWQPQHY